MQIIATPIPLLSKRFELKGPQREVGKTMAALTSYSPHRLGRNYSTSLSTDLAHKPGHRLGSKCFRITFATTLRLREIAPMTSLRITKWNQFLKNVGIVALVVPKREPFK
jgi:hypothetical protein